MPDTRPCPCGSGQPSRWQYDARGIELCRTCPACHARKMAGYRLEVLVDPAYEADDLGDEDDNHLRPDFEEGLA
jgi:hypothetical protein